MKKAIVLFIMIVTPILLSAQTKSFYVNGEDGRDLVKFTSKAPMETVEGETSMIKGFLNVSPMDITSAEAKFIVDLASLDTGIGLRDQHMRENHLETDQYPEAKFVLTEVVTDNVDITNSEQSEIKLKGDFTCHGITKPVEIDAKVQYFPDQNASPVDIPGESIHILANFDVYLSDYEIDRPKFLVLKLDDKQAIELDFWASTELPEAKLTDN